MTAIGTMETCGHVPLGSKPQVSAVVSSLHPKLHPISLSVEIRGKEADNFNFPWGT